MRMIAFYMPLPAPISIDRDFILTLDLGEPAPELHGLPIRVTEGIGPLPDEGNRFVSIKLLQTEVPAEILGVPDEVVRQVVKGEHPDLEALASVDGDEAVTDVLLQPATVAECVTLLREDVDDPVSESFDQCLEALGDLSRAYRTSTLRAIPLPTFGSVPAVVLYVLRTVTPPGDVELELGFFHAHSALPYGLTAEGLVPDDVERMLDYFSAMRRGHPGIPYLELRIEARLAHERYGAYRQSVTMAHTAVEVLLDTTLGLMLWEEGLGAEEAAARVFTGYASMRVKREFHPRLGGDWRAQGSGAVAKYLRVLAPLRHRAVHLGYPPTVAESAEALRIAGEVESHVSKRLLANKHNYPTTVYLFFGDRRLREVGHMTRRLRRHLQESDPDSWLTDYREWHETLIEVMTEERSSASPS